VDICRKKNNLDPLTIIGRQGIKLQNRRQVIIDDMGSQNRRGTVRISQGGAERQAGIEVMAFGFPR
jgi:hypothetical protein